MANSSSTKSAKKGSGVGRRKTAVVTARLMPGNGKITVNKLPAEEYFASKFASNKYLLPFKLTGTEGKYDIFAIAFGGGKSAQIDALTLAISKGLASSKQEFRAALRAAGLLTRDSRARQRRMVGTGGKARRLKQSPKR